MAGPRGPGRRPLASRDKAWAKAIARLAARVLTPNQISTISMVFAAIGCYAIARGGPWYVWIGAAICVQLRLLCNLIDGMVAVEGGKATLVGPLYNEFPDRIADTLLLVPVGYAVGYDWLGWALALAAMLTAYIRATGTALTARADFAGIMAKQRRMAALTLGLVVEAVEVTLNHTHYGLRGIAYLMLLGTIWTCCTRTYWLARTLKRG